MNFIEMNKKEHQIKILSFLTLSNHFLRFFFVQYLAKRSPQKFIPVKFIKFDHTQKLCVFKICEYWSSADVNIHEMQKFRGAAEPKMFLSATVSALK